MAGARNSQSPTDHEKPDDARTVDLSQGLTSDKAGALARPFGETYQGPLGWFGMDTFRATYRGYYIYIVRDSDWWSFRIAPSSCDLPILARPSLPNFASVETAMREARNRIDRVMAL